jgi:hypothetical protein
MKFAIYIKYVLTVLAVTFFFQFGPGVEANVFPIVTNQAVYNIRRDSIRNQLCYTWTYTKNRDARADLVKFNVVDSEGKKFDAVTTDEDNGNQPIYVLIRGQIYFEGQSVTRHYCTSLPDSKYKLTVSGKMVYRTPLNLWPVTHEAPSIPVPEE